MFTQFFWTSPKLLWHTTRLGAWTSSFHTLYHFSQFTYFFVVTQSPLERWWYPAVRFLSFFEPRTFMNTSLYKRPWVSFLARWLQTSCLLTVQRLNVSWWLLSIDVKTFFKVLSVQCNAWHWTDIESLEYMSVCLSVCLSEILIVLDSDCSFCPIFLEFEM